MDVSNTPPLGALESPGAAAPSVDTASLDRSMRRGLGWTGAMRLVAQVASWVSTIVVAHLLTPNDYGLFGMATVFLGLTAQATEFGIGTAVLAKRDMPERHVWQLNSVSVSFGVAAFFVGCIAAVPLSWFFRVPELRYVVVAMSTGFIFESFRTVPSAVLTRELRFKALAVTDALRALIGAVATVAFAYLGARYWSLVLGNLAAAVIGSGLVMLLARQRFARPRLEELRASLRYSRNVLTSSLAWYGYTHADFLVAGRILGQAALGVYTNAWAMATMPGEKLASMVGRVLPAMFSAASGEQAALRRYFVLATEAVALAVVPAATGLALIAPSFVPNVLGPQWIEAVLPMQILCAHAVIHMLSTLVPPLLNMTGRAGDAARNSILALFTLPPAFVLLGMKFGAAGIAAAWVIVYPFVLTHLYRKAFQVLGMHVREYLAHLWPAFSSAALMTAGVLAARALLPASVPPLVGIAIDVVVGAAVYTGALLLFHRPRLASLRTLAGGAKP